MPSVIVKVDVAQHLRTCGAPPETPVFFVDAFGIRDAIYVFDELEFLLAVVASSAPRLGVPVGTLIDAYRRANAAAPPAPGAVKYQ